jgi:hypothetical protein
MKKLFNENDEESKTSNIMCDMISDISNELTLKAKD